MIGRRRGIDSARPSSVLRLRPGIGRGPAAGLIAMSQADPCRSEEHTSELQSRSDLVCRLLLEKKNRLRKIFCAPVVQQKDAVSKPPKWSRATVLALRQTLCDAVRESLTHAVECPVRVEWHLLFNVELPLI